MMHYENYHLGGMHLIWWFVGVVILILIFAFLYSSPAQSSKKDTPLDILKRRLALGEISKDDFHEKKKMLEG